MHCASTNEASALGAHVFSVTARTGFLLASSKTRGSPRKRLVICYKPRRCAPEKVFIKKIKRYVGSSFFTILLPLDGSGPRGSRQGPKPPQRSGPALALALLGSKVRCPQSHPGSLAYL